MNVYFIDCENQNNLDGIEQLEKSSNVYLFVSEKVKIPGKNISEAQDNAIDVHFIYVEKCNTKPEIMDFILDTWLGYIISKDEMQNSIDNSYYIVSKDTGYENIVNFWKKKGKQIKLIQSFVSNTNEQVPSPSNKDSKTISEVSPLSKEDQKLLDLIAMVIKTMQSKNIKSLKEDPVSGGLLVNYSVLRGKVQKECDCTLEKKSIKKVSMKPYIDEYEKDKKFVLLTKEFLKYYCD